MGDASAATAEVRPSGASVRNVVLGFVAVVVAVAILGATLRGPIEAMSEWFVGSFGVAGLFAAVFLVDLLPFGTHDPVLFAGTTGGVPMGQLLLATTTASILGAWGDWILGRALGGRLGWVRRMAERRGVDAFLARYGFWAIVLAGVLPVPFGLVAWAYAMAGGAFGPLALGSLLRAGKVVISVGLIAVGWEISG